MKFHIKSDRYYCDFSIAFSGHHIAFEGQDLTGSFQLQSPIVYSENSSSCITFHYQMEKTVSMEFDVSQNMPDTFKFNQLFRLRNVNDSLWNRVSLNLKPGTFQVKPI